MKRVTKKVTVTIEQVEEAVHLLDVRVSAIGDTLVRRINDVIQKWGD